MAARQNHPAVHVSWHDAEAYCAWSGTRLPTEAEWEYAARGGLEQRRYPWGDELTMAGRHMCNAWQGTFPTHNTGEDGHLGTAPVTAYRPNGYGLSNMVGNTWEWCADWFSASFHRNGPRRDPTGPAEGSARIMRGGSYLCHESYATGTGSPPALRTRLRAPPQPRIPSRGGLLTRRGADAQPARVRNRPQLGVERQVSAACHGHPEGDHAVGTRDRPVGLHVHGDIELWKFRHGPRRKGQAHAAPRELCGYPERPSACRASLSRRPSGVQRSPGQVYATPRWNGRSPMTPVSSQTTR